MAERTQIEASLRTDFGLQRLSRGELNRLSRVSLLPRESASDVDGHTVSWRGGDFWLEFRSDGSMTRSGWEAPAATLKRKLVTGDSFAVGATTVVFECSVRGWPVDLGRERELLARDDFAAWSIYADELLSRGDPLGGVLANAGEFDLAFHLDVSPLVALGFVSFDEERGLWREITFRYAPSGDPEECTEDDLLDAGKVEAVLSHPRAWFARRVVLALPAYSAPWLLESIRRLVDEVSRCAGHFVEVLSLPNFPEAEALPPARLRVERG